MQHMKTISRAKVSPIPAANSLRKQQEVQVWSDMVGVVGDSIATISDALDLIVKALGLAKGEAA